MSESLLLQRFALLGALFAVMVTLLLTPVVVSVFCRKVTASVNRAAHAAHLLESAAASRPLVAPQASKYLAAHARCPGRRLRCDSDGTVRF
jgi:hypothetical protein